MFDSIRKRGMNRNKYKEKQDKKELNVNDVENFEEVSGKGLKYTYNNKNIKIGNSSFTGAKTENIVGTVLYLNIDEQVVGSIVLLLVVLFFQLRRNKILERLQLVEENQRFTHSKMAMALEVVDLLPWQWDLRTDEITYSSYKPIEQGKEEVSEMTYTTDINNYLTFVCEEDRERIRQVFKDVRANKVDKIKEEYRVHRPGKPDDSEGFL